MVDKNWEIFFAYFSAAPFEYDGKGSRTYDILLAVLKITNYFHDLSNFWLPQFSLTEFFLYIFISKTLFCVFELKEKKS